MKIIGSPLLVDGGTRSRNDPPTMLVIPAAGPLRDTGDTGNRAGLPGGAANIPVRKLSTAILRQRVKSG
ncbi:hypothetical protein Ppa06_62330 [Planomonospora parontospora subsp. parontospora]|uniref:Uncharacterized protein n=2 Tax=Planomonospora parontospora TaxID=58119 RepID=A0AA37BC73_9ACTN|nr:hypothetical protein GCM10010126_05970 [Planomonospora parontospora]GII12435.1 hypothetical protein Ppa06_62330 [Planomonospora parontospora subsp. parontospora]